MITHSPLYSDFTSPRRVEMARGSVYPFYCHTSEAERATNLPQLVARFALTLTMMTYGLFRISLADVELVASSVSLNLANFLRQLVDSGARGGALSPAVELVKIQHRDTHQVAFS